MAEQIGAGRCPACGNRAARLSVSTVNKLAYLTCPTPQRGGCGLQVFARSEVSDAHLRGWYVEPEPAPAPAPAPASAPAPEAAPAPARAGGFFGF